LAIILCIGILTSNLGGSFVSLAKDKKREGFKKYDMDMDDSMTNTLPAIDLIEMEPEAYYENASNDKIISTSEGEVLYEGTQSTLDPEEKDMFHIGEEEIKEMMQKGYSVEDIFEADRIANELFLDPQILLEKKEASDKSLEQIKKDILEESREKMKFYLKEKYEDAYEKLESKDLKETEIINLLAYADINNLNVSDQLVEEYQTNGDKLFKKAKNEINKSKVSQKTKKKYQISDAAAKNLSEELIDKLEILSQKTGKPVEKLVKGYMNSDSKK